MFINRDALSISLKISRVHANAASHTALRPTPVGQESEDGALSSFRISGRFWLKSLYRSRVGHGRT